MSQTITTSYHTVERTGAGRVTAKGGGKQRTVPWDHSRSIPQNHGDAAGELAKALGWPADGHITHMGFSDGTHKFVLND